MGMKIEVQTLKNPKLRHFKSSPIVAIGFIMTVSICLSIPLNRLAHFHWGNYRKYRKITNDLLI